MQLKLMKTKKQNVEMSEEERAAYVIWAEESGLLGPPSDPPDCGRDWNSLTEHHKSAFHSGWVASRDCRTKNEFKAFDVLANLKKAFKEAGL